MNTIETDNWRLDNNNGEYALYFYPSSISSHHVSIWFDDVKLGSDRDSFYLSQDCVTQLLIHTDNDKLLTKTLKEIL